MGEVLILHNPVCILYLQHLSVCTDHMVLLATILDRAIQEYFKWENDLIRFACKKCSGARQELGRLIKRDDEDLEFCGWVGRAWNQEILRNYEDD